MFKVIDSEQKWVKSLSSNQRNFLASIEGNALQASESGIPFFDVTYLPLRTSLSSILAVLSELGWEYVDSALSGNGYSQLIFKRVND